MACKIFVGALCIVGDGILLKRNLQGEGGTTYTFPGKELEEGETLEMALIRGFEEATGSPCVVGELSYVIETFSKASERTLNIFFKVRAPRNLPYGEMVERVPLQGLAKVAVKPRVLAGKLSADWGGGRQGGATYLVEFSG